MEHVKDLDPSSAAELLLGLAIDLLMDQNRQDSSNAMGLKEAEWKRLADHYGYKDLEDFQVDLVNESNNYMEEFILQ